MEWRRNLVTKKARPYLFALPRMYSCSREGLAGHANRPVIVANSFPKSGTHLLVQLLLAVPGLRDWGTFIASQPSVSRRTQPAGALAKRIRGLAPGELVGAHLHYSDEAREALRSIGALHFFIYRDLRDVAISEAHYLASMNRFHRMHAHFRDLPDDTARYRCAIEGLPGEDAATYPDIAERFAPYAGWLEHDDVVALRYEDLVGPSKQEAIERLADSLQRRIGGTAAAGAELKRRMHAAYAPTRSHTFRSGRAGGWKETLSPSLQEAFERIAGDLNRSLGYADPSMEHCA